MIRHLCIIAAIAIVYPQIGHAQDVYEDDIYADQNTEDVRATAEPNANRAARVVGGHAFAPSDLVQEATITSFAQMATGAGLAKANGLSMAALLLLFDGQFRVTDWLAVGVKFGGNAFVGSNVNSAMTIGANGGYEGGANVLLQVLRTDSLAVAANFSAAREQTFGISPLAAVEQSIAEGAVNASTILSRDTTTSLIPSVRAAYGITRWLGVITNVGADFSRSAASGLTDKSLTLNAGLSTDFDALAGIPVALLGTFERGQPIGDGIAYNAIGAGVFSAGRLDFALGAEFQTTLQASLSIMAGKVSMRYYW